MEKLRKLWKNWEIWKKWESWGNIARIANAVTITLYSRVTMQMLILLFSIVRNEISVSSVKSQVTSLQGSLRVFSKCICHCLCLCLCICLWLCDFGHVLSSHHPEQMSQRSQVSRIALRRCSQNVFVFVFVIVFVFVFVFVNFFGSCHLSQSGHVSSSHWSNVSMVASLQDCSLYGKSKSELVS